MLRHRLEEPEKQLPDNERPLASSDLDGIEHDEAPTACNDDVGESKPCCSGNETIERNEVPLIPYADKRTLQKFIEGDEILDQKNPFKSDDTVFDECERAALNNDRTKFSSTKRTGDDEELDFISKEEILRQSKYVKTYIKNPDKQLNYDKSVIQQMDAIRASGHQVKDVIVLSPTRPPIPAPRKINCQSIATESKTYTRDEETRSLPQGKVAKSPQTTVKPIPMVRRDYSDIKVRVGSADVEESLYDSNEVVQNALKFDSRFRTVEFGSQDDIDTIAEKTDIASTAANASSQSDINSDSSPNNIPIQTIPARTIPNDSNSLVKKKEGNFAEEVKKSFSNTIKSADFRKYLQSRGLTLIPTRQKQKYDANASGVSLEGSTGTSTTPTPTKQQRQPTKLSVLSKFLQSNIFEPKTGYSAKLQGSSTSLMNPGKPKNSSVNGGSNNNGSHIGRSSSMSVKPKVSFRQLEYPNSHNAKEDNNGQFATMDFNRTTRLRTSFAGRSSQPSLDSSYRRRSSMRNAGIQVNLEISKNTGAKGLPAAPPLENSSSRNYDTSAARISPRKDPLHRYLPLETYSTKGYTASSHTVVPLYSEPLRYGDPINNHIYEQTPDNLRREMLLYGQMEYIGSSQLSGWHPQDRRSYSSMQEAPTYGRLRPTYVSSISTQSTPVRRASENLDRQQILHKIYDFYRRSIRSSKPQIPKANYTEPALHNGAGVPPSGHRIKGVVEQPREQHFPNMEYGRMMQVVQIRGQPSMSSKEQVNKPQQTQYDRNIENIYSFVTKKMNQLRMHEHANEPRVGSIGNNLRNSTQIPPGRRVMFLNSSYNTGSNGTAQPLDYAVGEVDYVNVRGPPDGIQYRTSHC